MAEENVHAQQIDTMDQLREFIHVTLCHHENLDIGAWPMRERVLRRGGVPCGSLFVLLGPRKTVFTAIWETETNRLLFYGTSGERFLTTRLIKPPSLR